MQNLQAKLEQLIEIIEDEELDSHIWHVYSRYIKLKPEYRMSSTYNWAYESGSIVFHGEDGAMGCYTATSCDIDMKFFTNTEEEFTKLEQKIKQEKQQEEQKRKDQTKQHELEQLRKLKEKYPEES